MKIKMKTEDALKPFKKFYGKAMGIAHPDLEGGWDQIAFLDLEELESEAETFYKDPANKDIELDSYNTPFYTILTQGFFNGAEEVHINDKKWAFLGVLGANGEDWMSEGFGSPMQSKAIFLDLESEDGKSASVIVCKALSVDLESEEEEKYADDESFDWDSPRVVVTNSLELKLWERPTDEDEPDLGNLTFEKLV